MLPSTPPRACSARPLLAADVARRALNRVALIGVFCATFLIGLSKSATATPTVGQTIDFARVELTEHCRDAGRSAFSQIDDFTVGAVRSCEIELTPETLQLSVRQRAQTAAAHNAAGLARRPYALMSLDISFNRKSSFLCGPTNPAGRASLFVACATDLGLGGPQCAEREIMIPRSGAYDYAARYQLAAAEIVSLEAETCDVVARALDFIGSRAERASPLGPRRSEY
ncbi:MAG: hypothetical protein AAGM38_18220 [Pseudomonadota bacterium]